jgi:hypothetical protein
VLLENLPCVTTAGLCVYQVFTAVKIHIVIICIIHGLTNSLVAEPEGSTLVAPQLVIGHDSEPSPPPPSSEPLFVNLSDPNY